MTSSPQQYGLVGYPLGHSFSAGYFAEKFQNEGISATYENFELSSLTSLRALIKQHPQLRGFNVTIPHKQAILPLLDGLSGEAEAIGAVNVVRVVRTKQGQTLLLGDNSDLVGFRESLRPLLAPHHRQALVLGTGGASRAVIVALQQLGISPTYVSRRATTRSIRVGQQDIPLLTYDQLTTAHLDQFTLIVNCSPVGMHPHVDEAPALPYEALTEQHLLYDLVYNPALTRFLALGKAQGAAIKNGLEMLHRQAEAAWSMWQAT